MKLKIDSAAVLTQLVAFVEKEVGGSGLNAGVVGLSGGLDSSVSASITVRALGPENVVLVIMPHEVSSESSIEDALKVAEWLGVEPLLVPITEMTGGFPGFDDLDRIRAGNIMARMRMIVLYDLSAKHRGLVIGTSNKSEILLGYGTLYGDTACAINPLGDLYKTQLRQLAPALGLPESIRTKVPSADLWQGQTDEEELGVEYSIADEILCRLYDEGLSVDEVVDGGFERDLVESIQVRVESNKFKRQMPTICRLT
jgi:NAD+ synthase